MGLDITAYRQLTPDPNAKRDEDGNPEEWDAVFLPSHATNQEQYFPGRLGGIAVTMTYRFAEHMDFRAGSYSGYNQWRNWLATVAGFDSEERFWTDATPDAPFWELIYFSDCHGVLGAECAKNLAADFAAHQPDGNEWQMSLYATWQAACEMAADGGAIEFH